MHYVDIISIILIISTLWSKIIILFSKKRVILTKIPTFWQKNKLFVVGYSTFWCQYGTTRANVSSEMFVISLRLSVQTHGPETANWQAGFEFELDTWSTGICCRDTVRSSVTQDGPWGCAWRWRRPHGKHVKTVGDYISWLASDHFRIHLKGSLLQLPSGSVSGLMARTLSCALGYIYAIKCSKMTKSNFVNIPKGHFIVYHWHVLSSGLCTRFTSH